MIWRQPSVAVDAPLGQAGALVSGGSSDGARLNTAQYFDSKLETTGTCRNWNSVLKMLELSRLPARSG